MIFETHAHYDDKAFNPDRHGVIKSLRGAGVNRVVNVGADMRSSKASIDLAEQYDFIYASVGVHPHYVAKLNDSNMASLSELAVMKKVVAVGEIGLDYYRNLSPKDTQVYWFKKMLKIAENCNKPVIIHSRDASQETFDIIKSSGVRKGVVHCYQGSAEMAVEYVKMGYFIGVGGVITYPDSRRLKESVAAVGIDHIVLETDCPYLSPVPVRGNRNDSSNIRFIAEEVAKILNLSHEDVCDITEKNAVSLFEIK